MLLGILLSFGIMYAKGRMDVRVDPDSGSYLNFDFSSFGNSLRGMRTPGYPLFLQGIKKTVGMDALGLIQWMIWSGCVVALLGGLRRAGVSRCASYSASFVLLFSHGVWEYCGTVGTDCLAMSFAILGVACFLWSLAQEKLRMLPLLILAIITCATYLVRPAFLFLLVLWPTLGPWLEYFVFGRGIVRSAKSFAAMSLVSIIPFVAYSGMRYVVVGEFGLVSFAGYNLIGIGGQYLQQENLKSISDDLQPLAKGLIAKRSLVDEYRKPETFEDMVDLYNPTIWRMAVPAAEELYKNDVAMTNDNLKRLAAESISSHSDEYRSWLFSNGLYAAKQVVSLTLTDRGLRIFLVGIPMVAVSVLLGNWLRKSKQKAIDHQLPNIRFDLSLVFWLAAVFTLGKVLLVILVEPALGRYVSAAMLFVPCLVAGTMADICYRVFQFFQRSRHTQKSSSIASP